MALFFQTQQYCGYESMLTCTSKAAELLMYSVFVPK